jgi:hypothetical protein
MLSVELIGALGGESVEKVSPLHSVFKRGAKVGFSTAGKKQVLDLNLLTGDEFLVIIWLGRKF